MFTRAMADTAESVPEAKPRFECPLIKDNPDGWGPFTVPEQYKDVPYQPFSKSDKLGKVRRLPL